MCSMDRIENTNCSQLDFFREMQLTVNLSSHPACIRLRDGSFSHFNHSFATTFLHNINVNIWFNRLEISSSLRLSALDAEVYSGDRKMLVEENLPINGNRWDFIIERMSFDGTEFTLWKFCHLQRGGFLLSPVRSGFIKKLNEFKNAVGFLTDVQIETLALYSFGASHNQIFRGFKYSNWNIEKQGESYSCCFTNPHERRGILFFIRQWNGLFIL